MDYSRYEIHPRNGNPYAAAPTFHVPNPKVLLHWLEHYIHNPAGKTAESEPLASSTPPSTLVGRDDFNVPTTDIHRTDSEYVFNIEVPGITNKSSIHVHWTSDCTFTVAGEFPSTSGARSSQRTSEHVASKHQDSNPQDTDLEIGILDENMSRVKTESHANVNDNSDDPSATLDQAEEAGGRDSTILLGERRIGTFKRSFSLPSDANLDLQGTHARLEAGVLTIRVPYTKEKNKEPLLRIPVQ